MLGRAATLALVMLGCGKSARQVAPLDAAGSAAAQAAVPPEIEARLARLERAVDKLARALDHSLGPAVPDPTAIFAVPIDPRDPVEGPAEAGVTIVHAFELMDPFSYRADPVLGQVLAKYPRDVRVAWKYLAVHGAPAVPAGLIACAGAKQGAWRALRAALVGRLFEVKQGAPVARPEQGSLEQLRTLAVATGLDGAKLDAALPECQAWLTRSQDTLRAVGAHSPPAFFVNGRFLGGAQDFPALDRVIGEELAKATARIASGVAPGDYYQREIVDKGARTVKGRFED